MTMIIQSKGSINIAMKIIFNILNRPKQWKVWSDTLSQDGTEIKISNIHSTFPENRSFLLVTPIFQINNFKSISR